MFVWRMVEVGWAYPRIVSSTWVDVEERSCFNLRAVHRGQHRQKEGHSQAERIEKERERETERTIEI